MQKYSIILLAAALMTTSVAAADNNSTSIPQPDIPAPIWEIAAEERLNSVNTTVPGMLPLDVETKKEDGVSLLIKTFEVTADTDPSALVEEKPVWGGIEYLLRELTREQLTGQDSVKTMSDHISVESPSDKREDILPLLPEYLDYGIDGYTGRLELDVPPKTVPV